MEYRVLPHGGEKISIIGFGTSAIHESSEKEIETVAHCAVENGINYFDMASAEFKPFVPFGHALKEYRSKIYFQIHFGANYETGTYGWTTRLETIKRSIDKQLKSLRTDYIDFGFIHCIDEICDLEEVTKEGVIDYISELKSQGVIKHIGFSSHTPEVANKILDLGIVDMMMFSINPGYDYRHGEFANGSTDERMSLYRRCEREGVGISVMKPFSGGQMLDAALSPFKQALNIYQCIQYALDKPGVITVLPGISNMDNLQNILEFFDATQEEKDYFVIGSFTPTEAMGKCVYCNHCKPCPVNIEISLVNKYYDLAKAGDKLAIKHYHSLDKRADSCIKCGHCNKRCPFSVDQMSRMEEINIYFNP